MTTSKCRSCGADILWAKTARGKAIPLDAVPASKGNIVLGEGGTAIVVAMPEHVPPGTELYLSHFATCPNAKSHRKAPNAHS